VRALSLAMKRVGWPVGLQDLTSARVPRLRLWELSAASEPALLVAAPENPAVAQVASLGYTRQARYALLWLEDRLSLFDTLRWEEKPGDAPLFTADLGARGDLEELLDLISRDGVIEERPTDLALFHSGARREALPRLLGDALLKLRMEVANAEAYQGRDPAGLDTAVLRLFHQLLYVRVTEDHKRSHSEVRIEQLVNDREGANSGLQRLLTEYRDSANSELFEPAGIDIKALPTEPIREVLRQTVEPWSQLRLDFSVARADLAGRLYESYLKSLPVAEADGKSARLFPVATSTDEREKRASFYTPPALAKLLTKRTLDGWVHRRRNVRPSDIRIADCACGSGAFLTSSFEWLREYFEAKRGRTLKPAEREELLLECIIGADVDERALGMAQVQLLEAAEIYGRLPHLKDNLLLGDALPSPPGTPVEEGQIDWTSIVEERGAFTSIVANPPFGSQAKLPSRLAVAEISRLRETYPEIRAFGADYSLFFLALATRLLADDGTAGFIMPRGLIALDQGAAAREKLIEEGVSWITDLRAAHVFPGAGASVAAVVIDRREPAQTQVEGVRDSRINPRVLLDDLASQGDRIIRTTAPAMALKELVGPGWTPFRLRWRQELRKGLGRQLHSLKESGVELRTGAKPARVSDLVIDADSWEVAAGAILLDGSKLKERHLPLVVYSSDIEPFRPLNPGRRMLMPFELDGREASDPVVRAVMEARGGLPKTFRHGHLPTLMGPKILLRAFGREHGAVADTTGSFVPLMRHAHAIRFEGVRAEDLPSIAALLNSAFYQWMLRGFGAPRQDETIEVTVRDIGELPMPDLSRPELDRLGFLGTWIEEALKEKDATRRISEFSARRFELDEFVWDLLQAPNSMRDLVRSEMVRSA
jgi:hypothetical protein